MNLTPTEREVLRMLCEGMTINEIAEAKGNWRSAVTQVNARIKRKLGVRTLHQATYVAGKSGLDS